MVSRNRTYREVDGKMIRGTLLKALFRAGEHRTVGTPTHHYVSEYISAYEDGMIDCWGLVDLDGFKAKVRQGAIVTSIPEGAYIYLGSSVGIHLTATEVISEMAPEDLIGQVEDEIHALRGEPTSSDLCVAAYIAYQRVPSDTAKARLQMTYDGVPKHLREYLVIDADRTCTYIEADIRAILGLPDY